jgi:hypothetical protein
VSGVLIICECWSLTVPEYLKFFLHLAHSSCIVYFFLKLNLCSFTFWQTSIHTTLQKFILACIYENSKHTVCTFSILWRIQLWRLAVGSYTSLQEWWLLTWRHEVLRKQTFHMLPYWSLYICSLHRWVITIPGSCIVTEDKTVCSVCSVAYLNYIISHVNMPNYRYGVKKIILPLHSVKVWCAVRAW